MERVIVLMFIIVLALAITLIGINRLNAQDLDRITVDRPIFAVTATAESKSPVNTPSNIPVNESIRFIYDIAVNAQAKITPTLKSDLDVVPVISFKGVDVKRDPRIIVAGESLYQYPDRVKIESYVPPLQYAAVNPSGNIKEFVEGQEYVTGPVESGDPVVLKIKLVKTEDKGILTRLCKANFEVECKTEKDIIIGLEKCTGSNEEDCSATTRIMCGGQMKVSMMGDINCALGVVKDVQIETTFTESRVLFETGDTLLVSFFKNSECIRNANKLTEMMNCAYIEYIDDTDKQGTQHLDFLGNAFATFRVL